MDHGKVVESLCPLGVDGVPTIAMPTARGLSEKKIIEYFFMRVTLHCGI